MKILIVDDHELFRDGLSLTLATLTPSEAPPAISHAGCADKAIALLEQHDAFDLILLDLSLPDTHGMKVLKWTQEKMQECPVVIISATEKHGEIMRALDAGASGFIPKSTPTDVLIPALQVVLSGGRYLPPQLLATAPRIEYLTDRQMEVLQHMNDGMSNKMIARELALSESTVKAHIRKVFSVLQAKSRSHAISIATQLGIL
ncbi:MAG: response regulator transcription factor [Mariprofundus sp.]|nr:response regulator transcription factor [Mariprofundus sp.]